MSEPHTRSVVAGADVRPTATFCINCGATLAGRFCARCGQPVRPRITFRSFLRRAVRSVIDTDAGLLYTVRRLLRPGVMVREYLNGRTIVYTPPVRLLLICGAVTSIVTVSLGVFDDQRYQLISFDFPGATPDDIAAGNRIFLRWLNAFLIFSVPLSAALTRLLFRAKRLNYAEHLVFNSYVFAQSLLLMTAAMAPVFLVLGDRPASRAAAAGTWTGVGALYFLYACLAFFRGSRISTLLRAAAALFLASTIYPVAMALAIAAFVMLTK